MESDGHLIEANFEYHRGNLKTAKHHVQKAINLYPEGTTAYRLWGQICMDELDFTGAVKCFQDILKLVPTDLEAKFFLGYNLIRQGSCEEAIDAYQKFLEAIEGKRLDKRGRQFKNTTQKGIREAKRILKFRIDTVKSPDGKEQREGTGVPVAALTQHSEKETPLPKEPPLLDMSAFQDKSLVNKELDIKINFVDDEFLQRIPQDTYHSFEDYNLLFHYHRLGLVKEFDELLCLEHLQSVDKYWYQIETVSNVLKRFRGRVLLADEVGLGKTIEAGMLMKEYLIRGMIKRIIILTPPTLISQWQEEMQTKFGLDFSTTEDVSYRDNPQDFWQGHDRIIASINTAKSRKNFEIITSLNYDLVIVDEAHYLRNRTTLNYKLVNSLRKKFIFLLSATPVQNNLLELYNLITLLRPGTLSTEAEFKREHVKRGNLRAPSNPDKLRALLRDVMIRNTRSLVDVKLPKRFATTFYVEPKPVEYEIYQEVSRFIRDFHHGREAPREQFTSQNLLMTAGSSPFALREAIRHLLEKRASEDPRGYQSLEDALSGIGKIDRTSKGEKLMEIIGRNGDKKIIFVKYIKTMEYLEGLLSSRGYPYALFSGAMTLRQKDEAIAAFRDNVPVLVSTETGGEGRNLQFCNTLINYDLPWNPMRLEQRIGRLHRIGQQRDVYVFNLCLAGSIEDYMMKILDDKINMFELVIGEIDTILGNLETDKDFSNIIMDLWINAKNDSDLENSFNRLGEEIMTAKKGYEKTKQLDEMLFGDDYEV
ncbi:MAG: SNF2-related protein [Syntrophales bacterium]|nr:SNF2-related protein [Syntrophales bacterium]